MPTRPASRLRRKSTRSVIMVKLISILGLVATLAGFGFLKAWRDRKSGRVEERLEQTEADNEALRKQNDRIARTPRTYDERVRRLRKWRDYSRKHEGEAE